MVDRLFFLESRAKYLNSSTGYFNADPKYSVDMPYMRAVLSVDWESDSYGVSYQLTRLDLGRYVTAMDCASVGLPEVRLISIYAFGLWFGLLRLLPKRGLTLCPSECIFIDRGRCVLKSELKHKRSECDGYVKPY